MPGRGKPRARRRPAPRPAPVRAPWRVQCGWAHGQRRVQRSQVQMRERVLLHSRAERHVRMLLMPWRLRGHAVCFLLARFPRELRLVRLRVHAVGLWWTCVGVANLQSPDRNMVLEQSHIRVQFDPYRQSNCQYRSSTDDPPKPNAAVLRHSSFPAHPDMSVLIFDKVLLVIVLKGKHKGKPPIVGGSLLERQSSNASRPPSLPPAAPVEARAPSGVPVQWCFTSDVGSRGARKGAEHRESQAGSWQLQVDLEA